MKSYVTSGTGSQQTLTGSQDEKVAVYQTLADAEADLANLEAGQIVATPDTGDENAQPVDVIQAGNMHAVTSNAVATSNAMPVDVVALNNVHSVTSNAVAQKINSLDVSSVGGSGKYISEISEADGKINATASNLATSVASGNTRPVTSEAVASAIEKLYIIDFGSSDLNSERRPFCAVNPATANRPTNYGVCFSFGYNTSSTDPNASRWYYQLALSTDGDIFFRTATNPTSSTTTPDNWISWKRLAFA